MLYYESTSNHIHYLNLPAEASQNNRTVLHNKEEPGGSYVCAAHFLQKHLSHLRITRIGLLTSFKERHTNKNKWEYESR